MTDAEGCAELIGRLQAQGAQMHESRSYASWLLHQGSETPAVNVFVELHGPLPDWLAAR